MLFVFLIFFDQATKYLVRFSGGFFICNSNISFGIKIFPAMFWLAWLALIAALIYLLSKSKSENQQLKALGITLILGGAVSNIIDRLIFGCITDFINLRVWPIFNLADTFITIGAIIIALTVFRTKT